MTIESSLTFTPHACAAMGMFIFPTRGKYPPKDFSWPLQSSNEPQVVNAMREQFPGCENWAVNAGRSGLFILDIDSGKGPEAENALFELELGNGTLPDTFTVHTPSGGRHLYFKGLGKSTQGAIGKNIDTRSVGGYAVLPCAGGYHVEKNLPIADAPDWLIEKAGRATERQVVEIDPDYPWDLPESIEAAKTFLLRYPPAIEGQGGDLHTFKAACRMRDYGISKDKAFELMWGWNELCEPPWDESGLWAKVNSAYKSASLEVGNALPQNVFPEFDDPNPAPPVQPRTYFIDALDLIKENLTIDYLVQGMVETPATGLMFGSSTAGKTFLSLDLALGVATGTAWLGNFCKRGQVFYLAGEGKKGLPRRIKAWLKHHNATLEPNILHISRGRRELNAKSALDVIKEIRSLECEHGRPELIIIDTLARHIPEDADENSAKDIGAFINAVDLLRDTLNCVVLIVHHSGQQAADRSRGSSALKAALDFEIRVKDRTMEYTKQKDGETPDPIYFELTDVELENGIKSAVAIPTTKGPKTKGAGDAYAGFSADAIVALDVLKMEISTNGGKGVMRKDWKKVFSEQFGGDVSKRAVDKKFERSEAALLKNATIEISEGKVLIPLVNSDDCPF